MSQAEPEQVPSVVGKRHPLAWQPKDWADFMESEGQAAFRGAQVFRWLHRHGTLDFGQMSNLALPLRERLAQLPFAFPLEVVEVRRASDGTRKLLCKLDSGELVECVVIPMTRDPDEDEEGDDTPEAAPAATRQRVTLCISTQVGCAMGCVFCASGKSGLKRGLKAHEIIAQVLLARRHLDEGEWLRNIVFMGMGEPLHHYDETALAIRLITEPEGIAISPRRITVSTVGLLPGIDRLARDFQGKLGLAISLHAPNDAIRSRIVPMNERYPIGELLATLRSYPLPNRRRITIEYTLIDQINDQPEHARELVRLLRGLRVKVNLIPMNSIIDSSLQSSSEQAVARFAGIL
ncbi:MAG TPA: 23S rRNA (adenine(2503)-C(2))-methyltransferase RlmN, partial [Polyangiaceae bacterium]|nr:23S rRNA (adenine(2503)-C(2))-methyltransferase RlmN [Polyangiaceae bacterium]